MNKKYEEILINLVKLKAADFYGKNIPEPVQKRLDNELNYITEHKLSTKYMFAYETPVHLQKYIILSTLCDYTLVSFLLGLTEIDPLPPHYHCSCCGYIEFPFGHITEKTVWDLPSKPCPDCLENLHKYGYSVKLPNNANRNIICEYASSAEKQEILEFAKKFYNGYTLVYGIRNDKETHNKKTEENVKYKKNIVYIIPNEDIKYHNLSKIYFDLPVSYDIDNLSDVNYPYIYFRSCERSYNYLSHIMKERTGVGNLSMYLDDECVYSLFSSLKALGIENDDIICTGMSDILNFIDYNIRIELKDKKINNFTDLICTYENSSATDTFHKSADLSIIINILKLAFYKANYPVDYYIVMLGSYKNNDIFDLITANDDTLKSYLSYYDKYHSLAIMLYEMRKRKINLLPVNKYRSKRFEFSQYSDNNCLYGILPPLSVIPKYKTAIWNNNGNLMKLGYSNDSVTIKGRLHEIIYVNSETASVIFKIQEDDGNIILCYGNIPDLSYTQKCILKGYLKSSRIYGDHLYVTEYKKDVKQLNKNCDFPPEPDIYESDNKILFCYGKSGRKMLFCINSYLPEINSPQYFHFVDIAKSQGYDGYIIISPLPCPLHDDIINTPESKIKITYDHTAVEKNIECIDILFEKYSSSTILCAWGNYSNKPEQYKNSLYKILKTANKHKMNLVYIKKNKLGQPADLSYLDRLGYIFGYAINGTQFFKNYESFIKENT